MFDEPNEPDESPTERAIDPMDRARDKFDELRMHAEVVAVFEGLRKFEAQLLPGLNPELAREMQRTVGRLAKARSPQSPVLPPQVTDEAAGILTLPHTSALSTNDYHVHRRPGEVMIVRWLEGEQVETFYERIQAHFDAAMNQFRDEERAAQEWKQEPQTLAYLDALDKIDVRMADRYLREVIRTRRVFVLSDQSADELDIVHLTDYVMGATPAEVVGPASAPPQEGTAEQDRAWFFKLFSLRGIVDDVERMCFFTYLQKSDESF
jgi:hypothetical protein